MKEIKSEGVMRFIREIESDFGLVPMKLEDMSHEEFNAYVRWLDELWLMHGGSHD